MDAIVIEARGNQYLFYYIIQFILYLILIMYGDSVSTVGNTFREFCNILSENDPCHSRFMDVAPDEFPYWSLTFGKFYIFLN